MPWCSVGSRIGEHDFSLRAYSQLAYHEVKSCKINHTSCFLVAVENVRSRFVWVLAWLRNVKRNNVRLGTNY